MPEPTEEQQRALLEECGKYGIDINDVRHFWHKSKRISMFVVAQNRPTYETIREAHIKAMQKHAPRYPKLRRPTIKDPHLLVVDAADVHVGKYAAESETGYAYDTETAVKMAKEGVAGLLQKSSGFPIDKILFVVGNDVLHRDTHANTTTSGTRQDVDKMWHESYKAAQLMYVAMLEQLTAQADVHVVFNPSNHDYISGWMLVDSLACWFRNAKNITWDINLRHRKYFRYGKNLIATTHGDGAKNADMPLLMAHESADLWGQTRFRYIYQHHVHHKTTTKWQAVKDYPGITLETLRSPSAPDGWHDRNGYTGAPQAVEGFIHAHDSGQIARLTHLFK